MNSKTLSLLALVIGAALGGGYWLGQQQHASPAANARPERQVLYWYDPMVPGQRFDKPGKSPFMDMDLQPRYADEAADEAGVSISARQQQNLGIRTARVERRALSAPFSAYATVQNDERNSEIVPAPASGVVEKLFVRAPLQSVKKGEPLAQLWIPTWTTAQQEYLAVRLLGDSALTAAARERLMLQFMPEEVIRRVERSGKPQTRLVLRAPRDGYVAKLETRAGAQVSATAPLFELASLDPVWVVVDYPPSQAQSLRPGATLLAATDSYPGEIFSGKVSELLPALESTTRTLQARIVIANPDQKLQPGMYLTLTRDGQTADTPRLAIPEEALIETGSANRVLVAEEEGFFRAVKVKTGLHSDGWVEIISGLDEGEKIVTSGQFLIDSEASLRSALPAEEKQTDYQGTGVVEALEDGSVTIAHGPIPALKWGAMTMDFTLTSTPPDIKPGDRVQFTFTMNDDGAVIERLQPIREVNP
ncbi:efflux RND transporter periplasmic adaptor subunit [Atlantibacter hermannii]|uniref:efflux RND transporter periplasmic adaptor subunit n=1 Tax=Atlantibacter hermannii TaxID=565 RepID=UPI0028AA5C6A|nr:efflux RND transporter periplasmic adaptor subunit [Atlantibacter hermannii]